MTELITSTEAMPQPLSVRFIYMIPSDREHNSDYESAISSAATEIQSWYKEQTGGYTFRLNDPIVEIYYGKQTSGWYTNTPFSDAEPAYYFWYNTWDEMTRIGGMKNPGEDYTWVIYCDASGDGAANTGFAILPETDIMGLMNKDTLPVSRWIGGLGHEIGHAFRLPHPDSQPDDAIMWTGYFTYPNCFLLPVEISQLKESAFFFND